MKIKQESSEELQILALLSVVVAIAVSILFLGDVFYLNSGASFLFWNILGYLLVRFSNQEKQMENIL